MAIRRRLRPIRGSPSVIMKVHPEFKQRVENIRMNFKEKFNRPLTNRNITKMLTDNVNWESLFDISKGNENLNKRKKYYNSREYGSGYLDFPDELGLFK